MSPESEFHSSGILNYREVHDISVPLDLVSSYPGDRKFSLEWMARLEDGADCSLSALSLCSHAGTHLDFPAHILRNGKSSDQYPLHSFILPAQVIISAGRGESVPASALQGMKLNKGEALLFKTANSSKGLLHSPVFSEEYVYLSVEAARICAASGASIVGIDCLSVDKYDDPILPVHNILLENDILILEGLDLANVSAGSYHLLCLPLKIKDAEASPVRAVLLR
ncbi:Kynurenine formamidase [uncultured archaeon]|nr:Kynurenine formamidase [uncultured archaeon]